MKATKIILLLLTIMYLSSCKKKDTGDCPLCPVIKSLTPNNGFKGDTIILVGKNFSEDLHANIVKFNETEVPAGDMISGNTNQLKVRVPGNCGTGPVSVYIDDDLYSAPGPVFTYEYGSILGFSPLQGRKGDTLTIRGTKFNVSQNIVKVNGIKAMLISESDTLIKAIVPVNCGSGVITVTLLNGLNIKSAGDFTYVYTYTVSTYAGIPKTEGSTDGFLTTATFKELWAIGIDGKSRSIYVGDASCVRKINNSQVSTFAGIQTTKGYQDNYGKNALLDGPVDISVNNSGELFVADMGNNCIRKITSNGLVSTFCGKGKQLGDLDGKGTNALLGLPYAAKLYYDSILFIADTYNKKIKRCNTKAEVQTLALNDFTTAAQLAIKDKQTVLGIETSNNRIMQLDLKTSQISVFAGTGQYGVADGDALQATFSYPSAIATRIVQGKQEIYVVDSDSHLIRLIDADNKVSTVMGSVMGYADGENRKALFDHPSNLAFDPSNNGILYILDRGNKIIRKVIID